MFQTAFQVNAFQNNAFQIVITPVTPTKTGGDGWTREEWRRAKLQESISVKDFGAVGDGVTGTVTSITHLVP